MDLNQHAMLQAHFWLSLLALATTGCSEDATQPAPMGRSMPVGRCNAVTTSYTVESAGHVADCSSLPKATYPPTGGDHYLTWAAFQSYAFAVPVGFLIHSMEHGAVVLLYKCDESCPEDVQQAEDWMASLPEDPLCVASGALRRAILAPSPELPVRWAASAWGYTLEAQCFDAAVFHEFYSAHAGRGPENLCLAGEAFAAPPCP